MVSGAHGMVACVVAWGDSVEAMPEEEQAVIMQVGNTKWGRGPDPADV